jgi:DNA polymerase
MDIVTIDFETYYSKEYSLSKMTTEEYVRSKDFQVIGVGVKVNDHPTDWYTGTNPSRFLKSLDYSDKAILCHNTVFDGAILGLHFNIHPKLWLDTLSMARPLHANTTGCSLKALTDHYGIGVKGTEVLDALGKRREDFTPAEMEAYGKYCINDVEMTYKLFQILKKHYKVGELRVIDLLLRCYTEPTIELDVPLLEQHLQNTRDAKSSLLKALAKDGDEDKLKDILMSNDKFAALLQALKVTPPTKISQRTGKEAWAFSKTDLEFTALLEHPNPKVQAAVAARLGTKSTIEETRTENLLAVAKRGRLPILLNYWGAHTGRLSGGDGMNLQNLPSRGNTTIRRALRAPVGYELIACDSSQIEARIVAWLAGQDDLVQAFREGRDIYSEFATDVYGRLITKADKTERFVGKTCILGLGYGMGAAKLQRTLELGMGGISVKLELGEAERIVRLYRQKYHKIPMLWRQCDNLLAGIVTASDGMVGDVVPYNAKGVRLPNGMYLQYPHLRPSTNGYEYIAERKELAKFKRGEPAEFDKIYGGKVTENIVQALAAQVIREQMVEAVNAKMKIVLQVHDEIVVSVPKESGEAMEAKLVEIMSTPPKWAAGLPVACEAGRADNYGDT